MLGVSQRPSLSTWESILGDQIAKSGMSEEEQTAKFNRVREKLVFCANCNIKNYRLRCVQSQSFQNTKVTTEFSDFKEGLTVPETMTHAKIKGKYLPVLQQLFQETWGMRCELNDQSLTMRLATSPENFPKEKVFSASFPDHDQCMHLTNKLLNSFDDEVETLEAFREQKFRTDLIIVCKQGGQIVRKFPVHCLIMALRCDLIKQSEEAEGKGKLKFELDLDALGVDMASVAKFLDAVYAKSLITGKTPHMTIQEGKDVLKLADHFGFAGDIILATYDWEFIYTKELSQAARENNQSKIDELIADCESFGIEEGMDELIELAKRAKANPLWRLQPLLPQELGLKEKS